MKILLLFITFSLKRVALAPKFSSKRDAWRPLAPSAPKFSTKRDASRPLAPSAPNFSTEMGRLAALDAFCAKLFNETGRFAFLGGFGAQIFHQNGTLRVSWRLRRPNFQSKRDDSKGGGALRGGGYK